jgi:SAM-dependent methyltransferase
MSPRGIPDVSGGCEHGGNPGSRPAFARALKSGARSWCTSGVRARPARVVVAQTDHAYRAAATREAQFWAGKTLTSYDFLDNGPIAQQALNRAYTGNPYTTWLEDLIARGPFERAAVLGCTEGAFEFSWIRAGASRRLDVFDLSETVLARTSARLTTEFQGYDLRLTAADLNFLTLEPDAYDVVWSSSTLHHVTNLEHLCDAVAMGLRPGGLFAFQDYVGERRLQYAPERLRFVNAALARVPVRFRRTTATVSTPPPSDVSPFCAVRSDELMAVATAVFEPVHAGFGGALFPLWFFVDIPKLEREAPDILHDLLEAESRALAESSVAPPGVYAVFRRV